MGANNGNSSSRRRDFALIFQYPTTFLQPDEHRWSKAPILSLVGEVDDYTPASLVKDLTKQMQENGANADVYEIKNGHHSFDSINPVTFWPDALAIREKFAQLASDGSINFTTDKGEICRPILLKIA